MAEPLATEDLYEYRHPSAVAVSPEGDRAAFLVREADPDEDEYRQSLFVVPTDGSRDPHRLTRLGEANSPRWSPDGDRLAFIGTREGDLELTTGEGGGAYSDVNEDTSEEGDGGEDENGDGAASAESDDSEESGGDGDGTGNGEPKPQLWIFDLARGGDARQVTAFEEGIREFDWAPDGERIVVSARDPTDEEQDYLEGVREDQAPYEVTRLQHKFDGMGFIDDVTTYLFVLAADATGADRNAEGVDRLEEAYGRGAYEPSFGLQPAWGPGDRIGYVAYYREDPDETYALDVQVIDPDGSNRETLTAGGLTCRGLRWSPSGRYLSFAAGDASNFHKPTEIHVADPAAGETWSVSASLDRTTFWGNTAEWVDEDTLLAPVGDEARTRLVELDAHEDDPTRVFDAQGVGRTIFSFDATAETTVLILSHPRDGTDVFALPTTDVTDDGVDPTRLSDLNADLLEGTALPTVERVHFENGDGDTVEGLAWLPAGFDPEDPDEPLPLICHIHGGPMAYDSPAFSFDYAHWTGRGFAVLNVNYRGSTSYGRAFSEIIRGDWGPRETDDIRSGVDAVVERGWADPDRLFVSGFSQGGINTLYVLTRDDRFAAAAPEHGIYDFYSDFGPGDMHQWYVNDIGNPWEEMDQYRAISTLQDIDQVSTPLLVTAGEHDWRCPPHQAEQLYVSAKRVGLDAKLVVYQDEHHGLSRPDRHIHRLETLTDWFETHDPAGDGADG